MPILPKIAESIISVSYNFKPVKPVIHHENLRNSKD